MADVVDDDTLQAVRKRWQDDREQLPALVDHLPGSGRLKTPQHTPYAQLACELARRESAGTDGWFHDFRKVTITVRGVKAEVTREEAVAVAAEIGLAKMQEKTREGAGEMPAEKSGAPGPVAAG